MFNKILSVGITMGFISLAFLYMLPLANASGGDIDYMEKVENGADNAVVKIDDDPGAQIDQTIQFARSGRWGPFVGQILLFLVWGLRSVKKNLKPNLIPWITLGSALVASIAVGLIADNSYWQILMDGLITSGSAMALWSLLFKHFSKQKDKANDEQK